jgi:hypothetical protein
VRSLTATLVALLVVGLVQPTTARALPGEEAWRADVREAMAGSRAYLERRDDRGGRGLAVQLDIDNTALATHYAPGRAVPPVRRFARRAHRLHMRVLFNTARPGGDGNLRHTARALRRAGYPVTRICGRRRGEGVLHGKKRCRRRFREMGYVLVANVGNRSTDFAGGGYERAFRLPSYDGRLS